jgi:tetratricopeptide (TPR) repeat protein
LFATGNVGTYSFLAEIEAFERAVREEPGKTEVLDALVWDFLEAGYLQKALRLAERLVELEPLSLVANQRLFESLYAVGRTSEAVAALEIAAELGMDNARLAMGMVNLVEKRDDSAITHFEAYLQHQGYPESSWVRELVTSARDPATGQAYLDRRIPEIIAAAPMAKANTVRWDMNRFYLLFGFIDRYFEIILDIDLHPVDTTWTDADVLVYDGTVFRRLGFTAHPKYLDAAGPMGIVGLWEQRGPPDFCEKVGGQWFCE